jgi:serine/threonine protein kinase
MGVVYRARDQHLERDVALKVLPAGALADETARARFRREALSLSRLNHPNIEVVYDARRPRLRQGRRAPGASGRAESWAGLST